MLENVENVIQYKFYCSQRAHNSQSCSASWHCLVQPETPSWQNVSQSLTSTPKFARPAAFRPRALIRSHPPHNPQVLAQGLLKYIALPSYFSGYNILLEMFSSYPQKLQYSHLKSSGSSLSCLFHLLTSRAETNVNVKFSRTKHNRQLMRCFILYCQTLTMAPATIRLTRLVLIKPFYILFIKTGAELLLYSYCTSVPYLSWVYSDN